MKFPILPNFDSFVPHDGRQAIECRRAPPTWERIPCRFAKGGDQLPNALAAIVERLDQPIQTVSISFVPLFRDLGRASPDGVSIHLFSPTECRLKSLPSHHTFVNAVVRVCASKGRVWKRPLAGIEAVALVNKGCSVSMASLRFPKEDCLSAVAVARPLVQNKNPGEVLNIKNPL